MYGILGRNFTFQISISVWNQHHKTHTCSQTGKEKHKMKDCDMLLKHLDGNYCSESWQINPSQIGSPKGSISNKNSLAQAGLRKEKKVTTVRPTGQQSWSTKERCKESPLALHKNHWGTFGQELWPHFAELARLCGHCGGTWHPIRIMP